MRCPHHPKYKGNNVIKRLDTCSGCRQVREEYLKRIQQKRKYGQGSFLSLTTPNYSCSLAHLLAEVGVISACGQQPPWFWRNNDVPQRTKDHFTKLIQMLRFFLKDQNNYRVTMSLVSRLGVPRREEVQVAMEAEATVDRIISEREERKTEEPVTVPSDTLFESEKKITMFDLEDNDNDAETEEENGVPDLPF